MTTNYRYVFGTLLNRNWPYTETDFNVSGQMSSYWANFATTGDPNGKGLPAWTSYDPAAEPYLELGDAVQIKHHLLQTQLDALEQSQRRRPTSQ